MKKKFARVENGLVAQVWAFEDERQPDDCVEIPEGEVVGVGFSFDGSVFTAPPRPPKAAPDQVTKLQLVRALRAEGLWANARAMIAQADPDTQEDWQLAVAIPRADQIVQTLASALGLSSEQVDDVFRSASRL